MADDVVDVDCFSLLSVVTDAAAAGGAAGGVRR